MSFGRSRTGRQPDELRTPETDATPESTDSIMNEWSEVMTQQRPIHEPDTPPPQPIPPQPEPDEDEDYDEDEDDESGHPASS
jgi:hypothetical protein